MAAYENAARRPETDSHVPLNPQPHDGTCADCFAVHKCLLCRLWVVRATYIAACSVLNPMHGAGGAATAVIHACFDPSCNAGASA